MAIAQPESDTVNFATAAKSLAGAIDRSFYLPAADYYREHAPGSAQEKPFSFLWPLCSMWEATHELGKVTGNFAMFDRVFAIVQKYHDPAPPAPGYASYVMSEGGGARFYDDNQWIGITAMDALARTGDSIWLPVATNIYRFMMTGYDTAGGGGLYWKEHDHTTKNTCSNAPGVLLAMQLYNTTRNRSYLDTALQLYNWTFANLRDSSGLYWDNVRLPSRTVDKRRYSYNTGTMLQANLYLYEATQNTKYLHEAQLMAKNASAFFLGGENFKDGFWFNAVLMRGYIHLMQHDKSPQYILQFKRILANALKNNMHESGIAGRQKPMDLVAQGGLLEMLARMAWLQREKLID